MKSKKLCYARARYVKLYLTRTNNILSQLKKKYQQFSFYKHFKHLDYYENYKIITKQFFKISDKNSGHYKTLYDILNKN